MMGKRCPRCGGQTFHNRGPLYRCKPCRLAGWSLHQRVKEIGSGSGKQCPGCERQTLHKVFQSKGIEVRRCSRCSFATVRERS